MFRRKREDVEPADGRELPDDEAALEVADSGAGDATDAAPLVALPGGPTTGPFDAGDQPADGQHRLDFVGLLVPVVAGAEMGVNPQEGFVTLATAGSAVQLGAFAAPKSSGIWAEVRAEIVTGIRASGGQAEEVTTSHGVEVAALLPTDQPGFAAPARFVGFDGPRWFLRAVFTGAAGQDAAADPELAAAVRGTVVVRGTEAMAVRDPIPVAIPREVMAAAESGEVELGGEVPDVTAQQERPPLEPFARGPEITESR